MPRIVPGEFQCRIVATRKRASPWWTFYLVNDRQTAIESAELCAVKYEWGDQYVGGEYPRVTVTDLAAGSRALIWRDDGSSEMRTDLWLRMNDCGQDIWLLFEFPKLDRQRGTTLVAEATIMSGPPTEEPTRPASSLETTPSQPVTDRSVIEIIDKNGVAVVRVPSDDWDWEPLKRQVTELLTSGKKAIILDLSDRTRINALMIGTILLTAEKARAKSAEIKLSVPSAQVRVALELTGVARIIEIYSDVENAMAAFSQNPPPQH